MPTPSPTPTAAEKAKLRPILDLDSHAEVLALVSDFDTQAEADAEWALTLADLTAYDALYSDSGDVKKVGSIEFFEGKTDPQTLKIVNRIRKRYGVVEIATLLPTVDLVSTLSYF